MILMVFSPWASPVFRFSRNVKPDNPLVFPHGFPLQIFRIFPQAIHGSPWHTMAPRLIFAFTLATAAAMGTLRLVGPFGFLFDEAARNHGKTYWKHVENLWKTRGKSENLRDNFHGKTGKPMDNKWKRHGKTGEDFEQMLVDDPVAHSWPQLAVSNISRYSQPQWVCIYIYIHKGYIYTYIYIYIYTYVYI